MPTSAVTTIFLDDGGVMNDNTLRGPEWQRLVGEYLSPRLGGSFQTWGDANQVIATREFKLYKDHKAVVAWYVNDELGPSAVGYNYSQLPERTRLHRRILAVAR